MRPAELDALIEQGLDALRAAKGLSTDEAQRVAQAIARLEAEAVVEAPAEEPVPDVDSEPEPKAEPPKARRSFPSVRGKKGK